MIPTPNEVLVGLCYRKQQRFLNFYTSNCADFVSQRNNRLKKSTYSCTKRHYTIIQKNSQSTNSKQVDHYTVCFMFYLLKSNSKYQNTLLDGEIIKLLKRLFLNQFRNIFSLSVTKYSSARAI